MQITGLVMDRNLQKNNFSTHWVKGYHVYSYKSQQYARPVYAISDKLQQDNN